MEKQTEYQKLKAQWADFAKTDAYRELMEYLELQKKTYEIMASGPMEVYKPMTTFDGKQDVKLDFEPEKYAYLLQRGIGCDIVKMYVEGFTTPTDVEHK